MPIIGAFDARHLTMDNIILIILYDLYHIIRMPQGRQFDDTRFLGQYRLLRSTLDLALKMFFFILCLSQREMEPDGTTTNHFRIKLTRTRTVLGPRIRGYPGEYCCSCLSSL